VSRPLLIFRCLNVFGLEELVVVLVVLEEEELDYEEVVVSDVIVVSVELSISV